MATLEIDKRLRSWLEHHRPLCPTCRKRPFPTVDCARVWAPDWAADAYPVYPVDELEDPTQERVVYLEAELSRLREDHAAALAGAGTVCSLWQRRAEVAERELELLRRESVAIRDMAETVAERAAQDYEAANNWRRYVALVGEKRASLYVVPPEEKEDEH